MPSLEAKSMSPTRARKLKFKRASKMSAEFARVAAGTPNPKPRRSESRLVAATAFARLPVESTSAGRARSTVNCWYRRRLTFVGDGATTFSRASTNVATKAVIVASSTSPENPPDDRRLSGDTDRT